MYINSKLKNLKFTKPTLLSIDIESIITYLESDKYELSKYVFENNNLILLPFALDCNEGTKEQQKNLIIEYINQKKGLDKLLKSSLNKLDIKKDEEIINCLIENGCVYFLLENNLIEPNSEKEQTIIDNIVSNHPNYKKINSILYLTKNIVKYPNIIQTIIDNFKITEIKLESSNESSFELYEYNDEIHNTLLNIMRKKPNININIATKTPAKHPIIVAGRLYHCSLSLTYRASANLVKQFLSSGNSAHHLYFSLRFFNIVLLAMLSTAIAISKSLIPT